MKTKKKAQRKVLKRANALARAKIYTLQQIALAKAEAFTTRPYKPGPLEWPR